MNACVQEKRRNQIAINVLPFFSSVCRLAPLSTHVEEKFASLCPVALKHTESSNVRGFQRRTLKKHTQKKINRSRKPIEVINVIANLSSTCVCVCVCVSRLYLFFLLRSWLPCPAFPFYLLYSPSSGFDSLFPVFLSFHRCHTFFRKIRKFFFPTVQLLTGTLRIMNAIARLNIRTQKGARPAGLKSVCESSFDRVRTIVIVAVVIPSAFRTRNGGDHDDRRFCDAAGCSRADIFLLHTHINGRLARNVGVFSKEKEKKKKNSQRNF